MERQQFHEWTDKYRALALRVGWEYLYQAHDVQEVVQEALMACWKKHHSLESPEDFRRLLLGAVVNQCRKKRRSYARKPIDPAPFRRETTTPEQDSLKVERLEALRKALDSLPDEDREAVILCFVEDLSYEDAAGITGLTVPALRNRLYRARKALRSAMEDFLG